MPGSIWLVAPVIIAAVWPAVSWAGGTLEGRVVDSRTGQYLPARVYITGADGKPYLPPRGERGSIFHYDVTRGPREVYATIGAHPFRVDVPAGKTSVTVERGKEYVPLTREMEVGEGATVEAELPLERLFDMAQRGWYSGDLHVHTPLDRLGNMQLADDLNVAFPITAWATDDVSIPTNRQGPVPERGQYVRVDDTHGYWNLNTEYEIFKARGLEGELGAVMFLGHTRPFTLTAPPIKPIVAEARRQGVIIDWDKHCWPWSAMLVPVAGVDTIELSNNHVWRLAPLWKLWGVQPPAWMNCEDTPEGWASYGFQTYYALLNSGFRLRVSAGTANGVHPVPLGHSRVYVKVDGPFSYEKWVAGLRAGRSFATNGPMLLMTADGLLPGERKAISAGRNGTVNLAIEAFSARPLDRIEIIVNGKCVFTRWQAQGLRTTTRRDQFEFPVKLEGTSWIAARCFEEPLPDNVRFAHTGPVFFDDASRPLKPRPEEIEFLVERMARQLERVEGKLANEAVAEYREALSAYRAVKAKAE